MLRAVSAFIFLCSTSCFADSISLNPNDLPIFYSMMGQDPRYHDAAFKAQQAFFIQTGVTPTLDKINNYVTTKATNTVNTTIDKHTPFKARDVAVVVGVAYTVCVKRHVAKSFRNPWLPWLSHTIDISETSQSTGIKISF